MDFSNREDEQETSEIQFEDFALKTNVLAFASRSKAKAKPRRRTLASSSTRTVPIGERKWTDIEPVDYSPIAFPVSKQLSTLLHHGDLLREDDGAIEFCRKDYIRNDFLQTQHWSDEMWKGTMAKGGGNKKIFQHLYLIHQEKFFTSELFKVIQDAILLILHYKTNVIIQRNFFQYIYHDGCAINLHSIINSGLIPGGQNLNNRQTVFFLPVDPVEKIARILM